MRLPISSREQVSRCMLFTGANIQLPLALIGRAYLHPGIQYFEDDKQRIFEELVLNLSNELRDINNSEY